MSTLPLYERIKADSPAAFDTLGKCMMILTMTGLTVRPEGSAGDFLQALDNLCDALGLPNPDSEPLPERDVNTDDRPLYQQLSASPAAKPIKVMLLALNANAVRITDRELRGEYNAAMLGFWDALGLPRVEEMQSTPENYPGVTLGPLFALNEAVKAAATAERAKPPTLAISAEQRSAEIAELEELFALEVESLGGAE